MTRALLNKLHEIVKYLQKHENFEENMKTIIIPILIKYLNFNQLDVSISLL